MERLIYNTIIDAPIDAVWDYYTNTGDAANTMLMNNFQLQITGNDAYFQDDTVISFMSKLGIFSKNQWVLKIEDIHPPFKFTRTAITSPFPFWKSHHEFNVSGHRQTCVTHVIEYKPFGFIFSPFCLLTKIPCLSKRELLVFDIP